MLWRIKIDFWIEEDFICPFLHINTIARLSGSTNCTIGLKLFDQTFYWWSFKHLKSHAKSYLYLQNLWYECCEENACERVNVWTGKRVNVWMCECVNVCTCELVHVWTFQTCGNCAAAKQNACERVNAGTRDRVNVWTCAIVTVWTCERVNAWTCDRVNMWTCERVWV